MSCRPGKSQEKGIFFDGSEVTLSRERLQLHYHVGILRVTGEPPIWISFGHVAFAPGKISKSWELNYKRTCHPMLYEDGKLDLNNPITKWFPQFGNMKVLKNQPDEYEDAIKDITILDLLTHRAGFTYSGFQKGKLKTDYDRVLGDDIDNELTIGMFSKFIKERL
jgi:hypothetical protein